MLIGVGDGGAVARGGKVWTGAFVRPATPQAAVMSHTDVMRLRSEEKRKKDDTCVRQAEGLGGAAQPARNLLRDLAGYGET